MKNYLKKITVLAIVNTLFVMPCFSLDLDSTVTDKDRTNYSKTTQPAQTAQTAQPAQTTPQAQTTVPKPETNISQEKLPTVPKLPDKASSKTVAPINTQYSGKVPNSEALIPCTDIKVSGLNIDKKVVKSNTAKQQKSTKTAKATKPAKQVQYYKTALVPKGTQIRVVNQSKITDYLSEGQGIVFVSTQDLKTPYLTIPKNTKFTARVADAHRPQITCNG